MGVKWAGFGAEGAVGGVGLLHGELELMEDKGETLGTESMSADEGEQVVSVFSTFAALSGHRGLAASRIH